MRKRAILKELKEGLEYLRQLRDEEGVTVFRPPLIPSRDWTFDQDTADYIKQNIKLYLESWVILKIERAIEEVIISN